MVEKRQPATILGGTPPSINPPHHPSINPEVGKAEALEMIKGLSLGRRHRRAEVGWVDGGMGWVGVVGWLLFFIDHLVGELTWQLCWEW